jgi:hypothetical protein
LGVVIFADREPGSPTRGEVLDRGEIKLALVGGDLGQIS